MSVKYPRTYHLPWSRGRTSDDKVHTSETVEAMFAGRVVVATEKLDGENTTIHSDGRCHARSLDSAAHVSRTWVRALAARVALDIPEGWRVCGENLFAQHSLTYDRLLSYFVVFGIYDEDNICLSWAETIEWCELLDLIPAPVLFEGTWNEAAIRSLDESAPSAFGPEREGYVVRVTDSFGHADFAAHTAKFVRANHVDVSDTHWMTRKITPNKLGLSSYLLAEHWKRA